MKQQVMKAYQRNQPVDIIYVSKKGEMTKRRIKILKVYDGLFMAYCFTKHSPRTFLYENVLALILGMRKGRKAV